MHQPTQSHREMKKKQLKAGDSRKQRNDHAYLEKPFGKTEQIKKIEVTLEKKRDWL